jgi:hypothetical protein
LPPPIPLPSNPKSLLSINKPYQFEIRYLIEALVSHSIISTEDLSELCSSLRKGGGRASGEGAWVNQEEDVEVEDVDEIEVEATDQKKEAMLLAMFGMGRVSGRLGSVMDGAFPAISNLTPSSN